MQAEIEGHKSEHSKRLYASDGEIQLVKRYEKLREKLDLLKRDECQSAVLPGDQEDV